MTAQFDYDAYGNALGFDPATAPTQLLYTGQMFDATSMTYNLRSRSYDPTTGRFTSRDGLPSDAPSVSDRYAYANGDPTNEIDPNGQGPLNLGSSTIGALVFGNAIHKLITADFRMNYPRTTVPGLVTSQNGWANLAVNSILRDLYGIKGSGLKKLRPLVTNPLYNFAAGKARPDLVRGVLNTVWEIKPDNPYWEEEGFDEVLFYIGLLDLGYPSFWVPGNTAAYPEYPRYLDVMGQAVIVRQDEMGLVLYRLPLVDAETNILIASLITTGLLLIGLSFLEEFLAPIGIADGIILVESGVATEVALATTTADAAGTDLVLEETAVSSGATAVSSATATAAQADFVPVANGIGHVVSALFLSQGAVASSANAGSPPSGDVTTSLSPTDPRLQAALSVAERLWSPAIGDARTFGITIVVRPLASNLIGESVITGWNSRGLPTTGVIYLSPDADGLGWYLDPGLTTSNPSLPTSDQLGANATGHDDLLTAIEHELGHILGFDPDNPGYESHLQTIGGSEFFVGQGFSAEVAPGGELKPLLYPDDVMSATLAPGVRKLPSELDLDVISTLWDTNLTLPGQSAAAPALSAPAAIVDHAVAAQSSTPTPASPVTTASSTSKSPVKGKKAAHQKAHTVTIKTKHPEAGGSHKKPEPRVLIKPHAKSTAAKTRPTPTGSAAVELSRRGAITNMTRRSELKLP